MRGARVLIIAALALTACACAREAPRYVAIDPQTGQQIGVVQAPVQAPMNAPMQAAASPQAAQAMASADTPDEQPRDGRGLFGGAPQPQQPQARSYYPPQVLQAPGPAPGPASGAAANAQAYSPPAYAAPVARGRGAYAQQPAYPAQSYSQPSYRQQGYQAYASAPTAYQESYTLDTGDKLRVVVFGQDGLTSSYTVDAGGNVTLPLIGPVPARGQSTAHLANDITARLKQGYVREPKVTVEVEAYRPFFILGEVTTPGQYAYTPNMSAETAIAIAGGFGPRASKTTVKVTRNIPGQQFSGDVPLNFQLKPGDTVLVKERWF